MDCGNNNGSRSSNNSDGAADGASSFLSCERSMLWAREAQARLPDAARTATTTTGGSLLLGRVVVVRTLATHENSGSQKQCIV